MDVLTNTALFVDSMLYVYSPKVTSIINLNCISYSESLPFTDHSNLPNVILILIVIFQSHTATADSSGSPPTLTQTVPPRSQSSDRTVMRSVPNSPAREKRRARNDTNTKKMVAPLLPNQQQKLRSYEIGTTSSRAKVRAGDTPPSSPHRLFKKKRSLLSELKDNKIKQKETDGKKVMAPQVEGQVSDNKTDESSASVSPPEDDTIQTNGLDSAVDGVNGLNSSAKDKSAAEQDSSDCEGTDTSSWGTMSSATTAPLESPDQEDVMNANVATVMNGDVSNDVDDNLVPNGEEKTASNINSDQRFSVIANTPLDLNDFDMKVVDKDDKSVGVDTTEHKSDAKKKRSVDLKLDTKSATNAKSEIPSPVRGGASPEPAVKREKRPPSPMRSNSFEKRPASPKSGIPVRVKEEEADRLAMPPPTSLPIGRSRTYRKSGDDSSKSKDKKKQPQDSPVMDPPPNWKEAQQRLSGDDSVIEKSAVEADETVERSVGEIPDSQQNGHTDDSADVKPVNGLSDSVHDAAGPVNGYGLHEGPPVVSRSLSSTCDSIPDEIFVASASSTAEMAGTSEMAGISEMAGTSDTVRTSEMASTSETAGISASPEGAKAAPRIHVVEHDIDRTKMKLDLSAAPKGEKPPDRVKCKIWFL